jgi:hypothetical protein
MRRRFSLLLAVGAGVAFVAACSNVPFAPTWSADFFLPIQFADVALGGPSGVAPGGVIPPVNVTSTSPVDSQDVSGATKQILDESVNSIGADVVFATSADLTGSVQISVSPNKADLFSTDPTKAMTTTVTIRKTAGDTSHVTANVSLFQSQNQTGTCTINCGNNSNGPSAVNTLYSQSKTTVACRTGATCSGLTASDKLVLGVNLTVNVAVSK